MSFVAKYCSISLSNLLNAYCRSTKLTKSVLIYSKNGFNNANPFNRSPIDNFEAEENSENQLKRKKTLKKPKVYLKNDDGQSLGLMTLENARKIATKLKKNLIETEISTKIPTMQLIDSKKNLNDLIDNEELSSDAKSERSKISKKIITFSSKLTTNDLQTKIKQIKRLLLKDQEVSVRISIANPTDSEKLVS